MLRARVVALTATVAVAQYANLEKYAAFDTTHGVASSEGLSLRLGASSAVGGALLHGDEAWERRLEFGAPSVVYDTDRYKLWYGACVAGRCGSGDATRAVPVFSPHSLPPGYPQVKTTPYSDARERGLDRRRPAALALDDLHDFFGGLLVGQGLDADVRY